jgi:TetR/AcrR family transcriptional regulator, transcriptional repressor for nem operon
LNDRSTRERLLDAGRYLFWERGYAASGIAEILSRAGANAGSFYHFFPGKEALLLAVLDEYLQGLEPVIVQPAFAAHSDPIARIFAILAGYRQRLLDTGCTYGCPVGRLALEIEADNLPAHTRIAANFEAWTGAVRRCLEDASGHFPEGLDVNALATFVLTVMEGGVMQSRSCRRIEPFDQSVGQLQNYFACLTKEKAREKTNRPDPVLRRGRVRRVPGKASKPRQSH